MNRIVFSALFLSLCIVGCRRGGRSGVTDIPDMSVDMEVPAQDPSRDGAMPRPDVNLDEQPSSPSAPRFLSFATNRTQVQAGASVVFTAVLTDPQGIDDLIGGSLLDVDSGAEYGAFQTSSSEGSYQITLTWADIKAVRVPHANTAASTSRVFTARFFDAEGNFNTRAIVLDLGCFEDAEDEILCDGECVDATREDNCGACENECDNVSYCRDRACLDTTPRLGAMGAFTTPYTAGDGQNYLLVGAQVECFGQECSIGVRLTGRPRTDWLEPLEGEDPTMRFGSYRAADVPALAPFTSGCTPRTVTLEGSLVFQWAGRDGEILNTTSPLSETIECPEGTMLSGSFVCAAAQSGCD